jgi:hypothetical protein
LPVSFAAAIRIAATDVANSAAPATDAPDQGQPVNGQQIPCVD